MKPWSAASISTYTPFAALPNSHECSLHSEAWKLVTHCMNKQWLSIKQKKCHICMHVHTTHAHRTCIHTIRPVCGTIVGSTTSSACGSYSTPHYQVSCTSPEVIRFSAILTHSSRSSIYIVQFYRTFNCKVMLMPYSLIAKYGCSRTQYKKVQVSIKATTGLLLVCHDTVHS